MPHPANPVRKLGRLAFRRLPIAHLADVEADARLSLERDLRAAPTPIAGGMRKALNKERGAQEALRYRRQRRYRGPDARRAYGLMLATCAHCRHTMYFDEIEDFGAVYCDRCKRPIL